MDQSLQTAIRSTPSEPSRGKVFLFIILAFSASLTVRLIHYHQSLWCDEMGVPLDYARRDWRALLACGPGEYIPSNHPLHSIITKLLLRLAGETVTFLPAADRLANVARLPSLLAGACVPLLLAWGVMRISVRAGMVVLMMGIAQPWLISGSDESRGYALMTMLGIIATLLLPDGRRRWPMGYAIVIALMIYTVPVAGMLVIGHGMAMVLLKRAGKAAWLRGALLGLTLALLLYLPMFPGLIDYLHHPQPTPDNLVDLLRHLPQLILTGQSEPSPAGDFWDIGAVTVLLIGSMLGWRNAALRLPLAVMASTTMLFLLAAIVSPALTQMRFMPWAAIWMVLAFAGIAEHFLRRWKWIGLTLVLAAVGVSLHQAMVMLPCQPIREAIEQADQLAPTGSEIAVGFLAADDAVALYGPIARHHAVLSTPTPAALAAAEQSCRDRGQSLWLVVSYEQMVHDTAPWFWNALQARYQLKTRLPGRITPVAIYEKR